MAQAYLEKASEKAKKWVNKERHPREFQVGDLVLAKIYNHTTLDGQHRGLIQCYKHPFPILKKVGSQAYKVEMQASKMELPPNIKCHLVFHPSLLKPYYGDEVDPSVGISHRAPIGIKVQHDKEIHEVLVRDGNKTLTHLQPAKSASFKTQMGGQSGLNGYGVGMEKTGKDMGTGMGIGLNAPNPPRTHTRFVVC